MLRLKGAGFQAGRRQILRGVDVAVRPGSLTALIGPNGAGKSTALSLLAGDVAPSTGVAMLDGRPLADYSALALAQRRAVMRQGGDIAFAFTVAEVVAMGRAPHAAAGNPSADREAVAAALAAADLQGLGGRPVGLLSGGERQRVQFARALAQTIGLEGRGYLLLDEPTASLDLRHQHDLLARARRAARQGLGVLAVLHDLNLAAAYADEVVVLHEGERVAGGPSADVLQPEILSGVFDVPLRLVPDGGAGRGIFVAGAAPRDGRDSLKLCTGAESRGISGDC